MFYHDSMSFRINIEEVIPFLWFLNMTSHYRDLNMKGLREHINYVRIHEEKHNSGFLMYLAGTHGPFGNMYTVTIDKMPLPFIERPNRT